MIKLIVCDMDGTLLNHHDEISKNTFDTLMACQRQGIKLVLASGRSYARLTRYYEALQMTQNKGYLIEVNGLYINDLAKQERCCNEMMRREDALIIFDAIKEYESEMIGHIDRGLYYYIPESMLEIKRRDREERKLPSNYPMTGGSWTWVEDLRDGYPDQHEVSAIDQFPNEVNKVSLINYPHITELVTNQLKEEFGKQYEFVRSCPRALEITRKGVSKGNSLKRIMDKEKIQTDEVLVFGDGENDFSMFDVVTHSIAMGNAPDYVKARASEVTLTNNEEGIAEAIRKYIQIVS